MLLYYVISCFALTQFEFLGAGTKKSRAGTIPNRAIYPVLPTPGSCQPLFTIAAEYGVDGRENR